MTLKGSDEFSLDPLNVWKESSNFDDDQNLWIFIFCGRQNAVGKNKIFNSVFWDKPNMRVVALCFRQKWKLKVWVGVGIGVAEEFLISRIDPQSCGETPGRPEPRFDIKIFK